MPASPEVPGRFPVAINGRPYMINPKLFRRDPVELLRDQADTSRQFGESTLGPGGVWRRTQDAWRFGAGQQFVDKGEDAQRERFRASLGVNPWENGELTLLPDTTTVASSSGTNLKMVVAGSRLYWIDSPNTVKYTTDLSTTTSIVITEGIQDIASDGTNVYYACGVGGLKKTTTSSDVKVQVTNGTFTKVGFVGNRLLVANAHQVWNITDVTTTTAPAPLPAPVNTAFTWTCFGQGVANIYMGGNSGDKSYIYRLTIREDGTALSAPTVAAPLPDGEIVHCLTGYLGMVLIGTSKGFRLAEEQDGELRYGPVVEVGPVYALEPQDRFAWFTWGSYGFDGASYSGLGRMDLQRFTQPLVPAYASDLMRTAAVAAQGVVTFNDKRVFSLSGLGVFAESGTLRSEGRLQTGRFTFDMPDQKSFYAYVLDGLTPTGTSMEVLIEVDGGVSAVGYSDTTSYSASSYAYAGGSLALAGVRTIVLSAPLTGLTAEFTLIFKRTSGSRSPSVSRLTVAAYPQPAFRSETYQLPLVLRERVLDLNGTEYAMVPEAEFDELQELERLAAPVTVQIFGKSFSATVDGVILADEEGNVFTERKDWVQGLGLVSVRRLVVE